jgi:hypothetical protein
LKEESLGAADLNWKLRWHSRRYAATNAQPTATAVAKIASERPDEYLSSGLPATATVATKIHFDAEKKFRKFNLFFIFRNF